MVANEQKIEKMKLKEMAIMNNGKQSKKEKNVFSSFLLTVITGQNIAVRNNNENFGRNSETLDLQIPDPYNLGQFSNIATRGKYEIRNREIKINNIIDKNKNTNINMKDEDVDTTLKSYTLTEEVQRVLIEDFYPPISSSTVPGNPGRLFITLCTERQK